MLQMPELPEVETIARALRNGNGTPALPGRRILRVTIRWERHIAAPSPNRFRDRVQGRMIQDVSRRGKYLVFPLDQDTLLIHLRMSGDLSLAPASAPRDKHDHTIFELDDGWELRFNDARKFGRVYLLADPQEELGKLGPEPLDPGLNAEALGIRLKRHRRLLKPLLLDQSFIAGLGNIYTDEALHRAGIHPLRRSHELTPEEVQRLWKAIQQSLEDGISHNGASIDWVYRGGAFQNHFRVYGRSGEPCPECGTEIERIVVEQRGTHICPSCQREVES
jgi:formamidopyrimidine-DNA glycosylase